MRKINSVLCYFCERDALVKLKLLRSYCSDFYGSVLWDLSHSYVEDVCIAWRQGLRARCTHLTKWLTKWLTIWLAVDALLATLTLG